jgi:hypothetical protein
MPLGLHLIVIARESGAISSPSMGEVKVRVMSEGIPQGRENYEKGVILFWE